MREFLKKLTTSRHTWWGVAAASALEATVLPMPLELLLIPLMQANRRRMWLLAAAGGGQQFEEAARLLRQEGFWFVFSVGVTPVPFQIAMVSAGAASYSLPGFLAATALSRSIRYFGLAVLVRLFGDAAERLYNKHRVVVGAAATAAVVLVWVWMA